MHKKKNIFSHGIDTTNTERGSRGDDTPCTASITMSIQLPMIMKTKPSIAKTAFHDPLLWISYSKPSGTIKSSIIAYFASSSTTAFTSAPSAFPLSSFMSIPINCPSFFASGFPSAAIFASAIFLISSRLII